MRAARSSFQDGLFLGHDRGLRSGHGKRNWGHCPVAEGSENGQASNARYLGFVLVATLRFRRISRLAYEGRLALVLTGLRETLTLKSLTTDCPCTRIIRNYRSAHPLRLAASVPGAPGTNSDQLLLLPTAVTPFNTRERQWRPAVSLAATDLLGRGSSGIVVETFAGLASQLAARHQVAEDAGRGEPLT